MNKDTMPKGFERKPGPEELKKLGREPGKAPAGPGFMGRPGPGRSMGQKVEHAENVGLHNSVNAGEHDSHNNGKHL